MAYRKYLITDNAKEDLNKIFEYICVELCNPKFAISFNEELEETLNRICAFPQLYPVIENENFRNECIRKVRLKNYLLYYSFDVIKDVVIVLRIVYAKRNLDDLF